MICLWLEPCQTNLLGGVRYAPVQCCPLLPALSAHFGPDHWAASASYRERRRVRWMGSRNRTVTSTTPNDDPSHPNCEQQGSV